MCACFDLNSCLFIGKKNGYESAAVTGPQQ
jgi:hypothetical protein